jgi:hypothetical protein
MRRRLRGSLRSTAIQTACSADGAIAELFGGFLTVDGMRYAWRASIFTDLDGKRYLTDLMEFRPVDWAAMVKLER